MHFMKMLWDLRVNVVDSGHKHVVPGRSSCGCCCREMQSTSSDSFAGVINGWLET